MRVKEPTGRCPKCDNKVVQKSGSQTRIRVSHPLFFDGEGRCWARCHWCKSEIEIPLELQKGIDPEAEVFTITSVT